MFPGSSSSSSANPFNTSGFGGSSSSQNNPNARDFGSGFTTNNQGPQGGVGGGGGDFGTGFNPNQNPLTINCHGRISGQQEAASQFDRFRATSSLIDRQSGCSGTLQFHLR